MIYDLPVSVEVGGESYPIRSDFRAILDICIAMTDPELSDEDKALVALDVFYMDRNKIPMEHLQEALEKCFDFINCGKQNGQRNAPKLVDWEQDYQYIVAPINRVVGREIRAIPYDKKTNEGGFHWWSFISAYYEIGDCLFAQIVRIRDAQARGKKLDKSDQEWLRNNRHLVTMKTNYTEAEDEIMKLFT